MSVRCPHCENEVEPASDQFAGLSCPACGFRITVGSGETIILGMVSDSGMTTDPELTDGMRCIAPPMASGIDPNAPLSYDDFEMLDTLGAGGMGTVYRARQRSLQKIVAVKLLQLQGRRDTNAIARFIREARAVCQIRHPHVVDVHGIGRTPNGGYFFVMDHVEGTDLRQLLRQHNLSFERAAEITACLATAIGHAHRSGVIHRDLKPSNILVDHSGKVLITDFGIARWAEDTAMEMTAESQLIGTLPYMPPEQADRDRWGEITPRADIFGLGAILYELLVGQPPFNGPSFAHILNRIVSETEVTGPSVLNDEVPIGLESICLRCLRKNPSERYQTADEVACALDSWLATVQGPQPVAEVVRNRQITGLTLGDVEVLDVLGQGILGPCYRVKHRSTGEELAVRVVDCRHELMPHLVAPPSVLLALEHPNLVRLRAIGRTPEGQPFLAWDFVSGDSFNRLIKMASASCQPILVERALTMGRQATEALAYLHAQGVVHGDFEPHHALVDKSGSVRVRDYGVVRSAVPALSKSVLRFAGTTLYSSPERLAGGAPTPASDVYSFGCVLFELLSGQPPVGREPALSDIILAAESTTPFPSVDRFRSDVPAALCEVCQRCLEKVPGHRYSSAQALLDALQRC